ncbi:MAG: tetratricopeptide repeat protein, partial [Gammaproteobacteria bacterium]|nr:tetratricopeptide repeat protein [Gammaproteobacteria bacterium]
MQIKIITRLVLATTYLSLIACGTSSTKGTRGSLKDVEFVVVEEKVDGSLEKALQSYQKFLEETPETAMTPEALRRLADLKIQKEYEAEGEAEAQQEAEAAIPVADSASQATDIQAPDTGFTPTTSDKSSGSIAAKDSPIADISESEKEFTKRAGEKIDLGKSAGSKITVPGEDSDDLQSAGAKEAIELYKKLLREYPLFERNDQVYYQLSRAYEETGQIDIAMKTLDQLIKGYPQSRHIDESRFRRAEYFFIRKKYLDAEEEYQAVIDSGEGSEFYELALYKQGWAFFKQDMYEE